MSNEQVEWLARLLAEDEGIFDFPEECEGDIELVLQQARIAIDALTPAPQVGETVEEWGIYIYADSRLYRVDPSTRESAEREQALLGEASEVVTVGVGEQMQNAANHARHNAMTPTPDVDVLAEVRGVREQLEFASQINSTGPIVRFGMIDVSRWIERLRSVEAILDGGAGR